MDQATFRKTVEAEGYTVGDIRQWEANGRNGRHAHDFDAKLMVLEGDITITIDDEARTYRPGDIFAVVRGTEHAEAVGPDGARLLVGRK